jgi:Ca-activated chloride channel homolog
MKWSGIAGTMIVMGLTSGCVFTGSASKPAVTSAATSAAQNRPAGSIVPGQKNDFIVAMPPPLPGALYSSSAALAGNQAQKGLPEEFWEPILSVAEFPVSTFSADVDTASYARIRRYLVEGSLPPADAVRSEEVLNYFRYNYSRPKTANRPLQPTISVYPSPWRPGAMLLQIGISTGRQTIEKRPPADLVFLLDCSGSMEPADRLPLLKAALRLLVDQLNPEDRIALVTYANASETVLTPTSGDQKVAILQAIDQLGAKGGTNGQGGLEQAYALAEPMVKPGRTTRIILATDGDFNVGITDGRDLKHYISEKRKTGVALTVLGVGRENYRDSTAQALAQNGNGNAYYLDSLLEARKVLQEQLEGTLQTVATDVKLQVEFNPTQIAEYRLIGYELRFLNERDFKDDLADAGDVGAGHQVTALYEIVTPGSRALLLEPRRYQLNQVPSLKEPYPDELAMLRIRWKNPGETKSRLMERPVTRADIRTSVKAAGVDAQHVAAAAAFAQKLRASKFTLNYPWKEVEALANAGRGSDPTGERAEFVRLVRLAASIEHGQTPGIQ